MRDLMYQIGKLEGILKTFEWINEKVNHQYSFELVILDNDKSLKEQVEVRLKQWYLEATFEYKTIHSQQPLIDALSSWLFEYLPHPKDKDGFNRDALDANNSSISVLELESRHKFAKNFCNDLDSVLNIQRIEQVTMHTNDWYEAQWIDYAIEGEKGRVFLHLGVSD